MMYQVHAMLHTGGSIFLGVVSAMNEDEAGDIALQRYTSKNEKQAREIEECGGFGIDAQRIA